MKMIEETITNHLSGRCIKQYTTNTNTDLWWRWSRRPKPIICQVDTSNSTLPTLNTDHWWRWSRRPTPILCQINTSNSTPLTFNEDTEGGRVGDDSILLQVDCVLGLVRQPRLLDLQHGLAHRLVGGDGDARVFPQLPTSTQVVDIGHGLSIQGHLNLHPHGLTCEEEYWWTSIFNHLGREKYSLFALLWPVESYMVSHI